MIPRLIPKQDKEFRLPIPEFPGRDSPGPLPPILLGIQTPGATLDPVPGFWLEFSGLCPLDTRSRSHSLFQAFFPRDSVQSLAAGAQRELCQGLAPCPVLGKKRRIGALPFVPGNSGPGAAEAGPGAGNWELPHSQRRKSWSRGGKRDGIQVPAPHGGATWEWEGAGSSSAGG